MFSSFTIDSISYKLLNCWILNCASNIHVCNDSSRFQLDRFVNFDDQLRIEKIVYFIKRYDTVYIVVKKSHDSINIRLLDVVLASNFLINLVCLSKFTAKNVHWDIEKRHLYTTEMIFCYIESIEEHWMLKNNLSFSDQSKNFAAFAINSAKSKSNKVAIDAEWFIMLRCKDWNHWASRKSDRRCQDYWRFICFHNDCMRDMCVNQDTSCNLVSTRSIRIDWLSFN
jgi:hypothetical protein